MDFIFYLNQEFLMPVHAGDICHHLKQSSKIKVNLRGGLVIKTLMTPEMIISHPKQI